MTPKYKLVPVEPMESNPHPKTQGLIKHNGEMYWVVPDDAAPSTPHDPYKALEVAREALKKIDSPYAEPVHRLIACIALKQITQVLGDKEGK